VPSPTKRTSALGLAATALALLLSAPTGLLADEPQTQWEPPSLSDTVSEGLDKLKPLIDAKDWVASIRMIDDLLSKSDQESYDLVFLDEMKAKLLTQKGEYANAVGPLETSLDVAGRHHFYTNRQIMESLYLLSQLYYEESEGEKGDREMQVAALVKAINALQRWIKVAPKVTVEASEYYSQLLYSEAIAKNPAHPDLELIKESRAQTEKTLLLATHPKDSVYIFLLAAYQQEQDYKKATELLEFLLARNPSNKGFWQDLVNLYIFLAQSQKDPDKSRQFTIRAINAIERAQALGFMKAPRDNYNRFTFYYESGQYGTAADLLYSGLLDGSIDSSLDKWDLLASSFQQISKDERAIEVLQEASKRYPEKGELDLKIASIYAQLDNGQKAFEHYELAASKGGISKAQQSYLYLALAYQAYELGKFEAADAAIIKDIELQKGGSDRQQLVLKRAIEDAIRDRDAKQAAEAPPTT